MMLTFRSRLGLLALSSLTACSTAAARAPGGQSPAGDAGQPGGGSGGRDTASGGVAPGEGGSAGLATAGAGGNSATNGNAGSVAGGGAAGTSPVLPPLGPAPTDKPDTVEIGVRNNCAFPIWIHAQGVEAVLEPDDHRLQRGEFVWFDAPKQWTSARITAYGDGPRQGELEKVEMTLVESGSVLNYNLTYVDWVGLPVEVLSRGTGPDCAKVTCHVPHADILDGCPNGLLDGKRCQAARSFCLDGRNDDQPYCHALDDEIARCASTQPGCEGAAASNTANAYACDGFFATSPKWCAALNRGMVDDPENTDTGAYYQKPPFNSYAKWVHELCPGIYAFAYDDYPPGAAESGFHACAGGRELEITFCPAG